MKSLTYNPAIALSILLAAVFLEKHPEAEVNVTEKKGTDFLGKLKDEGFSRTAIVDLLDDEKDSDLSKKVALAIQSEYNDITKFENQFELIKLFKGDSVRQSELVKKGDVILNFVNSPSFEKEYEKKEAQVIEDEYADEPIVTAEDAPTVDPPVTE